MACLEEVLLQYLATKLLRGKFRIRICMYSIDLDHKRIILTYFFYIYDAFFDG